MIDGSCRVATHAVKAPGVPKRIDLELDYSGRPLAADGSDWIRVSAKLVDEHDTVCPFVSDPVALSVEGEGSIIGGAEMGANPVAAEVDIATVLVQANTRAGWILVRASASGFEASEATIVSVRPEGGRWS